jgi:hypothetical protein
MNCPQFIKYYCSPTLGRVTVADYYNMTSETLNFEHVRKSLLKLTYKEFLSTRYWKCISLFLRGCFKKCECGCADNLHVHHKNYKYIGIDHEHMNVLEVLCEDCHMIEHKKHPELKSKNKGLGYKALEVKKNTKPYNSNKKRKQWSKCAKK